MSETFVVSDNHYFHRNIIRYCNRKPVGFTNLFADEFEMNEYMIEAHNSIVKPNDTVFNLGDIFLCNFYNQIEDLFKRLNGKIILVTGNHDHHSGETRRRLNRLPFRSISDLPILFDNRFLFSHEPVVNPKYLNVHGHLHDRLDPNPMCLNVCVEQLDYKPISIDEITRMYKKRGL